MAQEGAGTGPRVPRWSLALAEAALSFPEEERERFLTAVVGESGDLRQTVEDLLEADGEDPAFLELPALAGSGEGPSPTWLSDPDWLLERGRLGPFELLSKLGSGSMGVVFLARRDGEDTPVALKVAREGTVPHFRMKQEGEILARLQHPAIASVLEAGIIEGRPFVGLEYVVGTPIDEYCAGKSRTEILQLFLRICDGVEAAHRNLVVHRDLKPSHMLITAEGEPKLLDFGVAKLLADSGDDGLSTATRVYGHSATLAYGSPEQLRGEPANTGSDVYSLGVVLYRTLTGQLPRQMESFRERDLVQAFASVPPAPSSVPLEVSPNGVAPGGVLPDEASQPDGAQEAAVREVDEKLQSENPQARELQPRERGDRISRGASSIRGESSRFVKDLDAIVLKALRPEPEARYPTVASFAHDLRQCLGGNAVAARRWSPLYRASRFLRRHPAWSIAGALVTVFLLAFGAHLQIQSHRLRTERDRAQAEKAQAEQVTSFISNLLRRTNPETSSPESMTVEELLRWGSNELEASEGLSSEVRETLLATLGEVNASRRHLVEAQRQLVEALELRRQRLGEEAAEVIDLQYQLGWIMSIHGNRGEAEGLARRVVESLRSRGDIGSLTLADGLRLLSNVLVARWQWHEVESVAQEAIALYRSREGDHSNEITGLELDLARLWRIQGRYSESLQLQRRGLERLLAAEPRDPLAISDFEKELAIALVYSEIHLDEAEELLLKGLATKTEVFGPESVVPAMTRRRLGDLRTAQGRYELARQEYDAALESARAVSDFETISLTLFSLGRLLHLEGQNLEAETTLAEAESIMRRGLREDHPYFLAIALEQGAVALQLGHLAAVEGYLALGRATCEELPDYFRCHSLDVLQGQYSIMQGEVDLGVHLITQGKSALEDLLGSNHSLTREVTRALAEATSTTGS